MRRTIFTWLLTLLVSGSVYLPAQSADPPRPSVEFDLTADEFTHLRKLLRPDPEELWRTIPWKTSLLEGQRAAAEQSKPLFIWAMDGHPLGCT